MRSIEKIGININNIGIFRLYGRCVWLKLLFLWVFVEGSIGKGLNEMEGDIPSID
jgi:hypothetical protein